MNVMSKHLYGKGPVTSVADATKRAQAWSLAGQPSHVFGEGSEVYCRVCGGSREGIQHTTQNTETWSATGRATADARALDRIARWLRRGDIGKPTFWDDVMAEVQATGRDVSLDPPEPES